MEAPILRWSQRSFKNHSLVSENGCLGMHRGILISPTSSCLGKYAVRFNGFTREGRSENVELRS